MENNLFLESIWNNGDVREIRIANREGRISSGYFNDPAMAAKAIEKYENGNFVYVTLNPVHPGLMARRGNKILQIRSDKEATTSDKDIQKIVYCLVDVDPSRPSGISSTDAEKAIAKEIAQKVMDEIGRPFILGDSGNGYHLIYKSNAQSPNETKAFLSDLQKRFGTASVGIDQKVFNPARITKVLGTWAIKGENTQDRPWRKSYVIFIDKASQTLDLSPFATKPVEKNVSMAPTGRGAKAPFDVEKFLADNSVIVREKKYTPDGRMLLILDHCAFDPSHAGKDACIIVHPDGKLSYQCFHDSCTGKTWPDFREAIGAPKGKKQRLCDTCGKEIFWAQDGDAWIPMENETTQHFCNARKRRAVAKKESITAVIDGPQEKSPRKRKAFGDSRKPAIPLPENENVLVQIPEDSGIGYVVTNLAVYEKRTVLNEITNTVVNSYHKIIDQPVRIEEVIKDVWSSDESVSIRWGKEDNQRAVFPVEAVSFSKHVDKLAAKGIRVNSNNVKETISYFAAALARDKKIKTKLSSYKNGWLDGHRFILGSRILEKNAPSTEIEFQGVSYVPSIKGTFEDWKKIIAGFKDDVGLAMRMGSAAISPALKALGCTSYLDHMWGGSTSGKTFSSILAASMFGNPFSLVESWRQSRSGKETYFEEAGGLPSFLDESHQAKPEDLEQTVYDFANEKGKGRATITTGGEVRKAKSKTWFGVLLSTGEGQIKECTQKAGVEARGLEFTRKAKISEEAGKKVNVAKNLLMTTYGHIAEEIIKVIMEPESLRSRFDLYIKQLTEYSTNNLQSRQVPYLAASLTGCKILEMLGVELACEEARIAYVIDYMSSEIPVPTWQKAYDFLVEQSEKYLNKFVWTEKLISSEVPHEPEYDCWGKIEDDGICFLADQAKRLLREAGFDLSVMSLLREAGKLAVAGHQEGKNNTITMRIRTRVVRVYKILVQ